MKEYHPWIRSIIILILVFALLSAYLFLRRGYYNLYIINKVLGSTSVVLAGMTLLIGPVSKRYEYFKQLLQERKSLGLTALLLGAAHGTTSLLLLPHKFAFPSWFLKEWVPVSFGFLALFTWVYLWRISRKEKIHELGMEVWRKHQSVGGKIAFLAVFLHLAVMKYQGWMNWFVGNVKQTPELANPGYPPASLFVFLIMLGIISYRFYTDFLQ